MKGLSRNKNPADALAVAGLDRTKISDGFGQEFEPLAKAHGLTHDFAAANPEPTAPENHIV